MTTFKTDGVTLVKLNGKEIDALVAVKELIEDLKTVVDGQFYITNDLDDGGIELEEVINAVEDINFVVLEEE
jgi:hypothetical protein